MQNKKHLNVLGVLLYNEIDNQYIETIMVERIAQTSW